MATETENDMVELQVETAVFIGLQMPKARAAKMTKEDLCGVVQSLLDDLGIYKDMYAGVTIKEIGCKWDEIPPEELDITSITNDDFPLIDSSEY